MPVARARSSSARSSLEGAYRVRVRQLARAADRAEDAAVDAAQRRLAELGAEVRQALARLGRQPGDKVPLGSVLAALRAAYARAQRDLVQVLARASDVALQAGVGTIEVLRRARPAIRTAESAGERAREQQQQRVLPGVDVGDGDFPEIRIDVTAPVVPPALRRHAAEVSASEVTTLAGAALGSITAAVQRAAVDGLTVVEAQQVVDQALPAPARGARLTEGIGASAERIVRTQLGRLFNRGAQDAAEKLEEQVGAGLLQKEWVASLDTRTRASHLRAHGQRVGTEDVFLVGGSRLRYPGDPLAPARETINCRCRMITVLPDDPEDLFRGLPAALPLAARHQPPKHDPVQPERRVPQPTPERSPDLGRERPDRAFGRRVFAKPDVATTKKIKPAAGGAEPKASAIESEDLAPGNALIGLRQAGLVQAYDLDLSRGGIVAGRGVFGVSDPFRGELRVTEPVRAALREYMAWRGSGKTPHASFAQVVYDGVSVVQHEAAHFSELSLGDHSGIVMEEGLAEAIARFGTQHYMARHRTWRGSPAEKRFLRDYLAERSTEGAYQTPTNLVRSVVEHLAVGGGTKLTPRRALAILGRWKADVPASGLPTGGSRMDWAADRLGELYAFDARARGELRSLLGQVVAGTKPHTRPGDGDLRFRRGLATIYEQALARGGATRRPLPRTP